MTCNTKIYLHKETEYLKEIDKFAKETKWVDIRAHMEATALQTEVNARITVLMKECDECNRKYPVTK